VRILFLALTAPFPPTNGHRLRTWSLLRTLAGDGHEVSLLVLADGEHDGGDPAPLREVCRRVRVLEMPRPRGLRQYAGRLLAALSPLPYGVWRLRSAALRQAVADELRAEAFDAVLCDGVYNMVNVPDGGHPVVLNKDDVAHVILDRYVALERRRLRRAYAWLEARKVRSWERRACARAALVLASSRVDEALLRRLAPQAAVAVVPNVVDTEVYAPAGEGDEPVVLFQGGMDWHPNRDAVEYFATAVWPALRARAPHAIFRVAGRGPDPAFRERMEAAGVQFTGTVPDMRAEIARAAVCVVPLRIGSGTRLKILEAAAMGKAIVSTPLGAEGLEFRDGVEIVLAEEPAAFARAVAALLADDDGRRALAAAARRRVEACNSMPVLRRTLGAALGAPAAAARAQAARPRAVEPPAGLGTVTP
jgi:glycosyltransferase involved in cell wall biosynthesis